MRFFFHVYDDGAAIDEEGRELSDAEAAKRFSIRAARELICDEVRNGSLNLTHRIEVEDEYKNIVFVLPFGEAVVLRTDHEVQSR